MMQAQAERSPLAVPQSGGLGARVRFREARLALGGLRKLLGVGAVLLLWQVVVQTGVVDPSFVPAPVKVAQSWWHWVVGPAGQGVDRYAGTWLLHAASSAWRVLAGFGIAGVVGIVLGVLIGTSTLIADLADPVVQILRPIPTTAWVAFAVIFFGIGAGAAIFLIALGAFFPVVLNTTHGVRQVPPLLQRAAAMLGTSRRRLLLHVVLPAALPSIFVGLRLGIGVAWVLVIVAEMVAVKSGLGFVLWDAYQYLRVDILVAAMLSVGLLGFLSDRVLLLVGRSLLRWQDGGL